MLLAQVFDAHRVGFGVRSFFFRETTQVPEKRVPENFVNRPPDWRSRNGRSPAGDDERGWNIR